MWEPCVLISAFRKIYVHEDGGDAEHMTFNGILVFIEKIGGGGKGFIPFPGLIEDFVHMMNCAFLCVFAVPCYADGKRVRG